MRILLSIGFMAIFIISIFLMWDEQYLKAIFYMNWSILLFLRIRAEEKR